MEKLIIGIPTLESGQAAAQLQDALEIKPNAKGVSQSNKLPGVQLVSMNVRDLAKMLLGSDTQFTGGVTPNVTMVEAVYVDNGTRIPAPYFERIAVSEELRLGLGDDEVYQLFALASDTERFKQGVWPKCGFRTDEFGNSVLPRVYVASDMPWVCDIAGKSEVLSLLPEMRYTCNDLGRAINITTLETNAEPTDVLAQAEYSNPQVRFALSCISPQAATEKGVAPVCDLPINAGLSYFQRKKAQQPAGRMTEFTERLAEALQGNVTDGRKDRFEMEFRYARTGWNSIGGYRSRITNDPTEFPPSIRS